MNSQSLADQVFNQQEIKIFHFEQHILHLKEQLATLKGSLQNKQRQNTQLINELQVKDGLLRDRYKLIQILKESNSLAQKTNTAERIKVISLIEQNQMSSKSIKQFIKSIKHLEENNLSLNRQIKILNERNEDTILLRNSLQSQIVHIDVLKNQNTSLVQKLKQYCKQNGLLRQSKIQLQKKSEQIQQKILNHINNEFNLKLKQIEMRSELEILELKQIVASLLNIIGHKNKILQKYDYELVEKLDELQTIFPKSNDQIQSFKNAVKFMSQQLKKKSEIMKSIKQKCNTFSEYNQKNNKLVSSLKEQIHAQQNQIQFLQKQNNRMSKESKRTITKKCSIFQKQTQQLKTILNELLWENQACHVTLYSLVGPNFKYSVDQEKEKLKEQFDIKKSKTYGAIDNRYLTVQQLINKNDQLMRELSKTVYGI